MNYTKRLGLAAAGLLAAGASLSVQAAFVVDGGSLQGLPVSGNDFNAQIGALGFDQLASGAQLRVDQDGYIDFYYVGAESRYNNSFSAGGSGGSMSEHDDAFDFAGHASFSIAVSADDIVDFGFSSDNSSASPVDNLSGINLQGLGILFDSSSTTLAQVLLGYDDKAATGDGDFDDMLIRADFRPALPGSDVVAAVPLPAAAGLFGAGLVGLVGVARRSRTRS